MLFGREAELAAVEGLIARAGSSRSGTLVVRGEPGVGKSALLGHAIGHATGMRVLRAGGIEAESELAFAGLHQLVHSVLDRVGRLAEPQAAALAAALGLSRASVEDRFLIGVAVLGLLAEAAEEMPLVCVVDDAQWLDRPSADALTFAARRLEAEGVVLLFAARDGEVRRFEAEGLAELGLKMLGTEAAGALLAHRVTSTLSPEVRDRLVESAGGNPLALIELSGLLSAEQLAGRVALPDPLPQSTEIERVYLERARRLPAAAQRLLLLVAADDTGSLATVSRAATTLGIEPEALEAAEVAGLVRAIGGGVEFRHPLVRSTLYGDATFAQRQAVHRALAAMFDAEQDADRRAWHRAAASLGEDEAVAGELEHAARRARRRSGFAAAGRALERAAELSSDAEARGRRLVAAAQDAWLAGRPEHALTLLDRAHRLVSDLAVRAEDMHLRGTIELRCAGAGGGRDDPRRRRCGDRARRAGRRAVDTAQPALGGSAAGGSARTFGSGPARRPNGAVWWAGCRYQDEPAVAMLRRGAADSTATSPCLGTLRPGAAMPLFANKGMLAHAHLVDAQPAAAQLVAAEQRVIGEEGAIPDFGKLGDQQHRGCFDVLADACTQQAEPARGQRAGVQREQPGAGLVEESEC